MFTDFKRYKYSLFWSVNAVGFGALDGNFRYTLEVNETNDGIQSILITNQFNGTGRYSPYISLIHSYPDINQLVVFHFELEEPLSISNISIPISRTADESGVSGGGGELRLLDWSSGLLTFTTGNYLNVFQGFNVS